MDQEKVLESSREAAKYMKAEAKNIVLFHCVVCGAGHQ
jgi:hypothetical protein